ncbi:MAG: hypothetical protein R3C61_20615 [Bacteroidia bacterium]
MKCEFSAIQLILYTDAGLKTAQDIELGLGEFQAHTLVQKLGEPDTIDRLARDLGCPRDQVFCEIVARIIKRAFPNEEYHFSYQLLEAITYDLSYQDIIKKYLKSDDRPLDDLFDFERVARCLSLALRKTIDMAPEEVEPLLEQYGFVEAGLRECQRIQGINDDQWATILNRHRWLTDYAITVFQADPEFSRATKKLRRTEVPDALAKLLLAGVGGPWQVNPNLLQWATQLGGNPQAPPNCDQGQGQNMGGPRPTYYDAIGLNFLRSRFKELSSQYLDESLLAIDRAIDEAQDSLISLSLLKFHIQFFKQGNPREALDTLLSMNQSRQALRRFPVMARHLSDFTADDHSFLEVSDFEEFEMREPEEVQGNIINQILGFFNPPPPPEPQRVSVNRFKVLCKDQNLNEFRPVIELTQVDKSLYAHLKNELEQLKVQDLADGNSLVERLLNTKIPIPRATSSPFEERLQQSVNAMGKQFSQLMILSGADIKLPELPFFEQQDPQPPFTFERPMKELRIQYNRQELIELLKNDIGADFGKYFKVGFE